MNDSLIIATVHRGIALPSALTMQGMCHDAIVISDRVIIMVTV